MDDEDDYYDGDDDDLDDEDYDEEEPSHPYRSPSSLDEPYTDAEIALWDKMLVTMCACDDIRNFEDAASWATDAIKKRRKLFGAR